MINLRKRDREALCRIAENCFNSPIEIWVYGSRVNGDSHQASDLDLVIRTADLSQLDRRELMHFQEQLQESNIPIIVQAFDWNKLPQNFQVNILKKYEVLFSTIKKGNGDA